MMRDEFAGHLVVLLVGILLGTILTSPKHEHGLLRFCMTHSIPLEQCKIPEEGK